MSLYQKFRGAKQDFSAIGLEKGPGRSDYFCTPKGARIIAWTGVDGIHYCHLSRFGRMVFAVDPMGTGGRYVYPVAESLEDFFRLVLACGGEAPVQQAYGWDRERFEAYLRENPPTAAQKAALRELRELTGLGPKRDLYGYIRRIQEGFDYSAISFKREYYEMVPDARRPKAPEWKVYFEQGFWSRKHRSRPGREVAVGKSFSWGAQTWYVPAVYVCARGLVVDLCASVDTEAVRSFIEKWLPYELRMERLTDELREENERENPLRMDFRARAGVNGRELRESHGYGTCWIPSSCAWEGQQNELEAQWLLEHYGLEEDRPWVFRRLSFPWATKRRPEALKSLKLHLEQCPLSFPGPHFTGAAPGKKMVFHHPVSGKEYTLTVLECEAQALPEHAFGRKDRIYPRHCVAMSYTVEPEGERRAVQVRDCAPSDPPRRVEPPAPNVPIASESVGAVAVIGGAYGPTAVILSGPKPQAAISSLHFEPPTDVEWRVVLQEKTLENMDITLLP